MKSWKRAAAFLAGAAIVAAGTVGCSDTRKTEAEPTDPGVTKEAESAEEADEPVEVDEDAQAEEVADAASGFMTTFVAMFAGTDPVPEEALEASEGDVEVFWEKLAISKYLSFKDLSEEEEYEFKANFYFMTLGGYFEKEDDAVVTVTFSPDAVSVDGDKAKVSTKGVTAVFDDEGEVTEEDVEELGWEEIGMLFDEGVWKVNARDLIELMDMDMDVDVDLEPEPEE